MQCLITIDSKFIIQLCAYLGLSFLGITCCDASCVGRQYGGGTVFCVSPTEDTTQCVTTGRGNYGLIASNQDQINYNSNANHGVTWASMNSVTGAISVSDGAANTATIIGALPSDNSTNNAAWLCHNYTDSIEGHTDWYLPSKNELNKLYLYAKANDLIGENCSGTKANGIQCFIGGYGDPPAHTEPYWSSSDYNGVNYLAGRQFFNNGNADYNYKTYHYGVRAIRVFGNATAYHPVITDVKKMGNENVDVAFSVADFADSFYSECGDNLTQVQIVTLPDHGTLKLSGLEVNATQEIPIENITSLTFNPNAYWYGNTNFSWSGYDGSAYSENGANVDIAVIGMDAPIILGLSSNSGKIGSEVAITINGSNFIDGAMKSTVKLMNGNEVIDAVVTNVASNQIICNIDLTGVSLAQIGPWDLVVTNPDGQSATLQDEFTIESGVEPIVSEITTEITDNILTITIGGSNFLVGITGVQVELTNGTDVIIAVIQTVTDGQIVCVVDVGSNPGVLVGEWAVQVTNADEKKSNEKTIRPKGMVSYSSSNGADKSWILPTAIAVPVGVVAIAAATASCLVLHKRHACCFRNGDKGNGAKMEVNMAAPVYD